MAFDPVFWKKVSFFALVRPRNDLLPARSEYDPDATNIGLNYIKESQDGPIWYAGPDLVASAILTRKPPEIVSAFRLIPKGKQKGLRPVILRGITRVDLRKQDFFREAISARARVNLDKTLKKSERDNRRLSLKILANAGSYGLFVEVNVEHAAKNRKKKVHFFSGEKEYLCAPSAIVEEPGKWYFPPISALITAGGRLLLAMLEREVTKAGGQYLLCDTDSMAVVATEKGGLVPCATDKDRRIKALSWKKVRSIQAKFRRLNPYGRKLVKDILKIEDVNFEDSDPAKRQRVLYGFSVSSKRYALFTWEGADLKIVKASEHALGFLYPPKEGVDEDAECHVWVRELWEYLLRGELFLPRRKPSWFNEPAMRRLAITTPKVLKPLHDHERKKRYQERIYKPFSFVLSPILNNPILGSGEEITLIAPFTKTRKLWQTLKYSNIYNKKGKIYRLGSPNHAERLLPDKNPHPKSLGLIAESFLCNAEAKSLGPDGKPCAGETNGLLKRRHITVSHLEPCPKETDRRMDVEDISLFSPNFANYKPRETERKVCDPVLAKKLLFVPLREIKNETRLSFEPIIAARRGAWIDKTTHSKLLEFLQERET
jgi:hypothetical protein